MPIRVFLSTSLLAATSVQGCCTPDDTTLSTPDPTETPTSTPAITPTPKQECNHLDEYLDGFIHSVEVASDGSFLVAVGGSLPGGSGEVVKTDPQLCVIYVIDDIGWPHSAREREIDGKVYTLITETGDGNILIYGPEYELLHTIHQLSDLSTLSYPNNADWITDDTILVTDRFQNKVLEMSLEGRIMWQYGGGGRLAGPHSGRRLTNGNTLIADSDNDRVLEVNSAGDTVWSHYGTLNWPRGVQRLNNGNTLIVSSYEGVAVEITPSGGTAWRSFIYNFPYETALAKDGSVIMSVIDDIVVAATDPSGGNYYTAGVYGPQ